MVSGLVESEIFNYVQCRKLKMANLTFIFSMLIKYIWKCTWIFMLNGTGTVLSAFYSKFTGSGE